MMFLKGKRMKLTENEKRDAIKLIEARKPLPDRYRFLNPSPLYWTAKWAS